MELIKMEWKRLLRHDSLWIFCALQILLLILVCNPYRLCRNVAPMDYSHRALRLLVEDYDKKELVNDMLQEDIASMEDTLEQYKSGYMAFDDETDVDAEISDLEEKLSKLNGKEMICLNGVERKRYRANVRKILHLCGLSNMKIHNLKKMDTHQFQKLEIPLSQKELTGQMDALNVSLGGCTYYGTCSENGSDYLTQELEMKYYAEDFEIKYQNNEKSIENGVNESVNFYNREIATSGYNGMFSAYILSKMQIILCLLLPVVFMSFADLKKQPNYFISTIGSFSFLCKKYIAYCVIVAGIETVIFGIFQMFLMGYAWYFACPISILKPLLWFAKTLLPEILFLGAVCVLIAMLSSAIMMFLVSGVFFIWAMEIKDSIHSRHFMICFNHIGQSALWNDSLNKMVSNRVIYICAAFCILCVAVILYSLIRNGKMEAYFNEIRIFRTKICDSLQHLLKMDEKEVDPPMNWLLLIMKHHIMNYYLTPMLLFCVYFSFVTVFFRQDMPGTELCSRFLPLLGIALAGAVALRTQEFPFEEILISKGLKRDIYIKDFIGIVLSFLVSVVFSYMILLQMSNILYMTVACTVLFNLICLVVSRSKGKAAGGIAVSVGCYILYNLFL